MDEDSSSTDVSSAQTFDVGAFLNNIATQGVTLAAQRLAPSQNTGVAAVTLTPNQRAGGAGTGTVQPGNTQIAALAASMGMTPQTLMFIGVGVMALVGLVVLRRK